MGKHILGIVARQLEMSSEIGHHFHGDEDRNERIHEYGGLQKHAKAHRLAPFSLKGGSRLRKPFGDFTPWDDSNGGLPSMG